MIKQFFKTLIIVYLIILAVGISISPLILFSITNNTKWLLGLIITLPFGYTLFGVWFSNFIKEK